MSMECQIEVYTRRYDREFVVFIYFIFSTVSDMLNHSYWERNVCLDIKAAPWDEIFSILSILII